MATSMIQVQISSGIGYRFKTRSIQKFHSPASLIKIKLLKNLRRDLLIPIHKLYGGDLYSIYRRGARLGLNSICLRRARNRKKTYIWSQSSLRCFPPSCQSTCL